MAATPFSYQPISGRNELADRDKSPLTTGARVPGTRSIRTGNGHRQGCPRPHPVGQKVVSSIRDAKPAGGFGYIVRRQATRAWCKLSDSR